MWCRFREDTKPNKVKEKGPPAAPNKKLPSELKCPMCNNLLTDAVLIPCCGTSYCDDCKWSACDIILSSYVTELKRSSSSNRVCFNLVPRVSLPASGRGDILGTRLVFFWISCWSSGNFQVVLHEGDHIHCG